MRTNRNLWLAAIVGVLFFACAEKEPTGFPWITDVNITVEAKGKIVGYEIWAKFSSLPMHKSRQRSPEWKLMKVKRTITNGGYRQMANLSTSQVVSGIAYITDIFNESGDSAWLEGWICGYTDPAHQYSNGDAVKDSLLAILQELRNNVQ